jgi:hypothetical protein
VNDFIIQQIEFYDPVGSFYHAEEGGIHNGNVDGWVRCYKLIILFDQ